MPRLPGAVMRVESENGECYDDPSEDMLLELLNDLDHPHNRFLTVDRVDGRGMTYMQACILLDGTYVVEYQDGSMAEHYETVGAAAKSEVLAALTSWTYEKDGWRAVFAWTRSDLG